MDPYHINKCHAIVESASALRAGRRLTAHAFAKETLVLHLGLLAGDLEASIVVGTPHPEIREMMKEVAEEHLAVVGVLYCVEDVVVPHLIDVAERNRRFRGFRTGEHEKVPIFLLDSVGMFLCPPKTLLRVHELELDRAEIELSHTRLECDDRDSSPATQNLGARRHVHVPPPSFQNPLPSLGRTRLS